MKSRMTEQCDAEETCWVDREREELQNRKRMVRSDLSA
jgi:hypothetical protein